MSVKTRRKNRTRPKKWGVRDKAAEYVWDYKKTHPCVDCGEKDPIVLEFDHVRGRKHKNISHMVHKYPVSLDELKKEITKCDIRCANCHRKVTFKRKQTKKEKTKCSN